LRLPQMDPKLTHKSPQLCRTLHHKSGFQIAVIFANEIFRLSLQDFDLLGTESRQIGLRLSPTLRMIECILNSVYREKRNGIQPVLFSRLHGRAQASVIFPLHRTPRPHHYLRAEAPQCLHSSHEQFEGTGDSTYSIVHQSRTIKRNNHIIDGGRQWLGLRRKKHARGQQRDSNAKIAEHPRQSAELGIALRFPSA